MRGKLERTMREAEHVKTLTEIFNNLIRETTELRATLKSIASSSQLLKTSADQLTSFVHDLGVDIKKLKNEITLWSRPLTGKVIRAEINAPPGKDKTSSVLPTELHIRQTKQVVRKFPL